MFIKRTKIKTAGKDDYRLFQQSFNVLGDPVEIRTLDPQLRRLLLYPAELLGHKQNGAGDGNRTHITSLEGWGSTIELHPQIKKWSEQQDSNLRPPGPKPGALPNCAMPREHELLYQSKPPLSIQLFAY